MKCYNHPNHDAVGVCKSCQKGICLDCSTLVDESLSCKGRCEEDVAAVNYMLERSKKVYKNLGSQWTPAALINCAAGAFFLGFGLYYFDESSVAWLTIGLGLIMLVGGVLSFRQGQKMSDKTSSNKTN